MKHLLILALAQLLIFTAPFSQVLAEQPAVPHDQANSGWTFGELAAVPVLNPIGTGAVAGTSVASQDSLQMKGDSTAPLAGSLDQKTGHKESLTLMIVVFGTIVAISAAVYVGQLLSDIGPDF